MAPTQQGPAARYLEQLQEQLYLQLEPAERLVEDHWRTHGEQMRAEIAKKILDQMKAHRRQFLSEIGEGKADAFDEFDYEKFQAEWQARVPTKYEDPNLYALLCKMAEQIEKAAREWEMTIPRRPLLGTLRLGQVNACAIPVPDSDECIIAFNKGMFGFMNLMAKIVVQAFPVKDRHAISFSTAREDVDRQLETNPAVRERFVDLINAYILYGDPHRSEQYLLEEPYATFTNFLRDSGELFVLGHEYGHVINGDLEKGDKVKSLLGHVSYERVVQNWSQEFGADLKGLQLMLTAMREHKVDLSLSYWGGDFFFSCVDVLCRALSLVRTGREELPPGDSHPPPRTRRTALRAACAMLAGEERAEPAVQLANEVVYIFDRLWEMCRPFYARLHREGAALAGLWNPERGAPPIPQRSGIHEPAVEEIIEALGRLTTGLREEALPPEQQAPLLARVDEDAALVLHGLAVEEKEVRDACRQLVKMLLTDAVEQHLPWVRYAVTTSGRTAPLHEVEGVSNIHGMLAKVLRSVIRRDFSELNP